MSTTTPEQWLALAERIEKATGPNRLIDARICVAIGDIVMRFSKVTGKWAFWTTPVEPPKFATLSNVSGNEDDAFRALSEYTIASRYTGSPDIITALIERELPVEWLRQDKWVGRRATCYMWLRPTPSTPFAGSSETPALALCAAFCRAMAEHVPKT